jgi:transcriptional regulator with XRE-family HTH domain
MRGVTVRDLEKETNLSKATINRILSYEPTHDIKIASLLELSSALKCPLSAIFMEHITSDALVSTDIQISIEKLLCCRTDTRKKLTSLIEDLHLLDQLKSKL